MEFRLQKNKNNTAESGNTIVIVLVALVVIAVGAFAFLSGKITGDNLLDDKNTASATEEIAQTDSTPAGEKPAAGEDASAEEGTVIRPGNPVVAKVGDEDVTRVDVFNFIQTLPAQTRNLPPEQLFPLALEQVVNAKIIGEKAQGAKLDNDEAVKAQLEVAKEQIVRTVYLQKEVEKGMTEERKKQAYEAYKEGFAKVEELKASHILVEDEALAKDLIKQIKDGADFAELAKANSTDGTAENGGELGYFAKADVVPEFGAAADALEVDEITAEPVKSQFGYHVIKLEERRMREPATFEEAMPFLEGQLRQAILNRLVEDWRNAAKVERFDINGDAIETAGE